MKHACTCCLGHGVSEFRRARKLPTVGFSRWIECRVFQKPFPPKLFPLQGLRRKQGAEYTSTEPGFVCRCEALEMEVKATGRLMEVLKSEQEAYGCTNEAFPGENQASLARREVSRSQTNQYWIVRTWS